VCNELRQFDLAIASTQGSDIGQEGRLELSVLVVGQEVKVVHAIHPGPDFFRRTPPPQTEVIGHSVLVKARQ